MLKHRIFTILSVLAVLALFVTACAPQAAAPAPKADAPKADAPKAAAPTAAPAAAKAPAGGVAVTPAGEFPIVKDKITMKVFMCPNTAVSDYINNEFTKWLEAKTNIKLEFDLPPVADAQNKLNLMLASDDLPEVIIGCNIRLDQMQILAEQGVALPLNDYIDQVRRRNQGHVQDQPGDRRPDHPARRQDLRVASLQRLLPLQYVAEDVGLQAVAGQARPEGAGNHR